MKHLTLRIDEKELNKLRVIAKYEGRSVNGQILVLLRDRIEEYEKGHKKTNGKGAPK